MPLTPSSPCLGSSRQRSLGVVECGAPGISPSRDLLTTPRHIVFPGLGWSPLTAWDLRKIPKWVLPSLVHSLPYHSLLSLGGGKSEHRGSLGLRGREPQICPGLPETGPPAVSGGPRPLPPARQPKAGGLPGGATAAREPIGCPRAGSPQPAPAGKLPLVSCAWQKGSPLPNPLPPSLTN